MSLTVMLMLYFCHGIAQHKMMIILLQRGNNVMTSVTEEENGSRNLSLYMEENRLVNARRAPAVGEMEDVSGLQLLKFG